MQKKDNTEVVLIILGIIPTIWLALLIAPISNNGLIEIINKFDQVINNPFKITLVSNTLKCVLLF